MIGTMRASNDKNYKNGFFSWFCESSLGFVFRKKREPHDSDVLADVGKSKISNDGVLRNVQDEGEESCCSDWSFRGSAASTVNTAPISAIHKGEIGAKHSGTMEMNGVNIKSSASNRSTNSQKCVETYEKKEVVESNCVNLQRVLEVLPKLKSKGVGDWEFDSYKCYCYECCGPTSKTNKSGGVDESSSLYAFRKRSKSRCGIRMKQSSKVKTRYPYGWVRCSLKLSKAQLNISQRWHVAYHGTTKDAAISILADNGLKAPDNVNICSRPFHASTSCIYSTPSIKYASFVTYATPFQLEGDNNSWWQLIMEVCHRPSSYKLHPQTLIQGHYVIDSNFENSKLAWKTSDAKNIMVTALLIRSFTGISSMDSSFDWSQISMTDAAGMPSNKFSHSLVWWQPWDGAPPLVIGPAEKYDRLLGKCGCNECIKNAKKHQNDK